MFRRTKIPALLLSMLLCSWVLAQAPSEADVHFSLGETYLKLNQYTEAIKEFRRAINLKPNWPEAYFELGLAYSAIPIVTGSKGSKGDNTSAALKAFEQAVQLKPDWPEYPFEFSLLKNLSFATQPQELHTYSLETISKITV